jgi:hypothetical protein
VSFLVTAGLGAPAYAQDYACGSMAGAAVDFWYCWNVPPDENTGYQYNVWEKHVDAACWRHSAGFAQGGTGPAYADLAEELGPPVGECPRG